MVIFSRSSVPKNNKGKHLLSSILSVNRTFFEMAHCLVEIYIENDTNKNKRGDYSEKNFLKSKREWLKDGLDQKSCKKLWWMN